MLRYLMLNVPLFHSELAVVTIVVVSLVTAELF